MTAASTPDERGIYPQPVEWKIYSKPMKGTRYIKARSEYQARCLFEAEYGEVTTIEVSR